MNRGLTDTIYLFAPPNFLSLTPAPPPFSAMNSRTLRLSQIKPESGFQMVISIVDDLLAIADDPEGFAEA
jgi:hypothetical protein